MYTLLTLKDVQNIRQYQSGILIAHVLSLRINTTGPCDLIVTDYSRNHEAISEWTRENVFMGMEFPRDQLLHLGSSLVLIQNLCKEYKTATGGSDLFRSAQEETSWIDITERFVIARLIVNLRKKENSLTGVVKDVTICGDQDLEQPGGFWDRFLVSPLISNPGFDNKSPTETLRLLRNSELTQEAGKYESQVKIENQESDSNSQLHLGDYLEPASQYTANKSGRSSPKHLELAMKPSQNSESQSDSQSDTQVSQAWQAQNTQFLTQVTTLHSHPEVDMSDDQHRTSFSFASNDTENPRSHYSLAELNRIPLRPNNKIYHTQAVVVGCIPSVSRLVTKPCATVNHELTLRDPSATSFELILADASVDYKEKEVLSSKDSLSIHIAAEEVLSFFKANFTEQLYPRLHTLAEQFARRKPRRIPLQLVMRESHGIVTWVPHDLTFDRLV